MPTTTEISDYVTGLSSATLTGAEEVYLATDEKATVQDIANFGGKVWKCFITQTGTSAPVITVLVNTLGAGTITPAYTGVGYYTLSGFGTALTSSTTIEPNFNIPSYLNTGVAVFIDADSFAVYTQASGTNDDDILDVSAPYAYTITITKYD
jgi:hypothetical protein